MLKHNGRKDKKNLIIHTTTFNPNPNPTPWLAGHMQPSRPIHASLHPTFNFSLPL